MLALLASIAALAAPAQSERPLTLYSSFPLQGASRPQSEDIVRAIKLAVRDRGGRIAGRPLRYVSLDDSTAAAGQWDAAQVKANARFVAGEEDAIAYIGEFNSGATANSLPTLNEAGILQVSPSNTARGLTRDGPGAEPGEPEKYYPTGKQTYARVIPIDPVQAAAQVSLMERAGVRRLFVLDDRTEYGSGVAAFVRRAAGRRGIDVVGRGRWDGSNDRYRGVAGRVARSGADAVFAGGIVDNNAPQLFIDLYRADRGLRLYAPDGMATVDFTRELPPGTQRRVTLTAPTVAPRDLPPSGRRFYRRFSKRYDVPSRDIDPYAVYAYAAADRALDAVEAAGGRRAETVRRFFAAGSRPSVLGRFRIDKHGDTTLRLYGVFGARGGRLVYERAVR